MDSNFKNWIDWKVSKEESSIKDVLVNCRSVIVSVEVDGNRNICKEVIYFFIGDGVLRDKEKVLGVFKVHLILVG